jgi:hypothetical protein
VCGGVRLVRDLALSLLFVTRNSIWQLLFSCSFERAVAYHRWISNTVLARFSFSFSLSLFLSFSLGSSSLSFLRQDSSLFAFFCDGRRLRW